MNKPTGAEGLRHDMDRHWIRLTLVAWVGVTAWYVWQRWGAIHWFALGDTDDNMRLMQVRALLGGQGWYDLTNYRLDPPGGFNIHWTRLVDLPIAGLILFFRLFTTEFNAERWACGLAPLLPLSIAMIGIAATARRLIAPLAWPLALVFLIVSGTAMMSMFMPERIDHHGWQLAMLSLTVAGLCDSQGRRGGLLVGASTAVSLTIGLEMLPYGAMAGAIVALRWVWDRTEAPRLVTYGLSLGGGSALGYAAFASYANRVARCDALTPVWLSVMVVAGALLVLLGWANPRGRAVRFLLAAVCGVAIGAGFALVFPQCLGRPEQVSPELARTWLDNVKEAKPIFRHPFRIGFAIAATPVIGIVGAGMATWRARRTASFVGWLAVLLFGSFAAGMLLWQVRAGPAAQLLAVPGITALGWIVFPRLLRHATMPVRVLGTVAAFVILSGLFTGLTTTILPAAQPKPFEKRVNRATALCLTWPALHMLDRFPAQTIFTFIDLGPRLITVTHHDAVAGPYHRNGDAILDVQHAFGGTPERARAIMKAHGATLLLVCPNMAESTIYRVRNPGGFYDQLAHGRIPAWLTPVKLPASSPFRLWEIH